jgi:polyphosphate glucokinase
MKDLPSHVMLGANSNAIDGGLKLWQDAAVSNSSIPAVTQLPKPRRASYNLKSRREKK